jgi:serine/threonine protein kinase/DNA-binding beta-propeller fold protein YncE
VSDETPAAYGGFAAGSQVAGYRLEEQIGRGGMAVVFRARDSRLGRRVALKILAPELARDDAFRQRFIRESRAAAAVDHPHIIPVFEAGESEGVLFIAMRYVVGRDVRSLLDATGPLPPGRAVTIVTQVSSALDAAHSFGLVHRDVKPGNMLLDSAGGGGQPDHIYLSDFGLSKQSLSASGLTGTGQFLGTLDYVAPEQIEGKLVDGRADQYALAGAAYEMLGGSPPFRRDEGLAILWAQISATPPPVTNLRPELPEAVNGVLLKALAKAPADRYDSCLEFAAALRAACGIRPDPASDPGTQPGQVRQRTELAMPITPPVGPAPGTPQPAGAGAGPPATSGPSGILPPPVSGYDAAAGPPTSGPMAGPPTAAAGEVPGPSGTVPPGGVGGPPTEAARAISSPGPRQGSTKGGLTEPPPSSNPYGLTPAYGPPAPRPPWYRSKALVALAAVVAVAAIGGGGYVLFGNQSGGNGGGNNGGTTTGGGTPVAAPATLPKCVQKPVNGKPTPIINDTTQISNPVPNAPSHPFAVATTPDGKYTFVTLGGALAVLKNGKDLMPTLVHTINMPGANKGFTFSKDGQDLLVATDGGANAYSVSAAEQGRAQLLGKLLSPGGRGAVQDTFSPDGKFLFVTLQSTTGVAVFNYKQAKDSGFANNGYIGNVPTGKEPVGIELSPDGKTMYVTSMHRTDPKIEQVGGIGFVSVIDVHKAETNPEHAVLKEVTSGCNPVRVIVTPDGKTAWVTVRESDALLAFSTAKMLSDPKHALIARVDICSNPIGESFAADHTRVVAACSDLDQNPDGKQGIAIVDTQAALDGQNREAYTGMVVTGGLPRQFTVRGDALMVTNYGAGQLLAIDINDLP